MSTSQNSFREKVLEQEKIYQVSIVLLLATAVSYIAVWLMEVEIIAPPMFMLEVMQWANIVVRALSILSLSLVLLYFREGTLVTLSLSLIVVLTFVFMAFLTGNRGSIFFVPVMLTMFLCFILAVGRLFFVRAKPISLLCKGLAFFIVIFFSFSIVSNRWSFYYGLSDFTTSIISLFLSVIFWSWIALLHWQALKHLKEEKLGSEAFLSVLENDPIA